MNTSIDRLHLMLFSTWKGYIYTSSQADILEETNQPTMSQNPNISDTSITKIIGSLKITFLQFHLNFPGANELTH